MQITPRTALWNLADLKPGTTHHYRLVAISQLGVTYGEDATFMTT